MHQALLEEGILLKVALSCGHGPDGNGHSTTKQVCSLSEQAGHKPEMKALGSGAGQFSSFCMGRIHWNPPSVNPVQFAGVTGATTARGSTVHKASEIPSSSSFSVVGALYREASCLS